MANMNPGYSHFTSCSKHLNTALGNTIVLVIEHGQAWGGEKSSHWQLN